MKKIVFNSIKYILFLAIGVLIFWLLYRKIEWKELVSALKDLKYQWLVLSVILSLLAHFSRALRWKMLIKPMGYNPSTTNTFLSILILYFVNLIIPRAGEVARCTVLNRTDKIPFTKLVGTVFIERLADMIMLAIVAVFIFALNVPAITEFFNQHPVLLENAQKLASVKYIFVGIGLIFVAIVSFFLIKRQLKKSKKKGRLVELRNQLVDGIKSIARMEKKWLFIGHTVFIFLTWLIMLYVVFLAYKPTENVTIQAGMVAFLMGAIAMIAPVQGGIGPWHFMVSETLVIYGVSRANGLIFALIAHTTTNLIYILIGGIALTIIILRYGNRAIRLQAGEKQIN